MFSFNHFWAKYYFNLMKFAYILCKCCLMWPHQFDTTLHYRLHPPRHQADGASDAFEEYLLLPPDSTTRWMGHFGRSYFAQLFPCLFSHLSLCISILVSLRPDHIMTDLLCIKGPCPCFPSLSPPFSLAFISRSPGGHCFLQHLQS